MRRLLHAWLTAATVLLIVASPAAADSQSIEFPFHSATTVRFASIDEASDLLGTADSWIKALSPFDRMAHSRQLVDPGEDAYLAFMAAESRVWTEDQVARLQAVAASADRRINRLDLDLNLPSTVWLIRTSGNEQSNAAYTRENAIILPDQMLNLPDDQLESLFLHELFHIMSRHDPALREVLYPIIGFYLCANAVYPEELLSQKMTNPDAFGHDFCIDVGADGDSWTVMPILYGRGPYTGGGFFEWMEFRLLAVERVEDRWEPVRGEEGLRLFESGEVTGFFERIGNNTNYIIHPEETMADNFVFAVTERDDLPNPQIVDRLREALRASPLN